jgi:inositol oxygenase
MVDQNPLTHPDQWDDDVLRRYPEPDSGEAAGGSESASETTGKTEDQFRNYEAESRSSVKEFYRLNHRLQTFEFVDQKRREYLPLQRKRMGVWEAMEFLNTLVDDSDPDTELSQIEHLLQTAESIRADGHPRWFVLTGLIHDLGKILCLFGEPQWAVVGDTFPVGCAHSSKIVFHKFFESNPDWNDPRYKTEFGVYRHGIGLEHVMMSWGHDEYLYHVVKDYLPREALYMIRYHSFYAAHRERDYEYLFDASDHDMFAWVRAFNPYDLYSKSDSRPDVDQLRPFYEQLIEEFLPGKIAW